MINTIAICKFAVLIYPTQELAFHIQIWTLTKKHSHGTCILTSVFSLLPSCRQWSLGSLMGFLKRSTDTFLGCYCLRQTTFSSVTRSNWNLAWKASDITFWLHVETGWFKFMVFWLIMLVDSNRVWNNWYNLKAAVQKTSILSLNSYMFLHVMTVYSLYFSQKAVKIEWQIVLEGLNSE